MSCLPLVVAARGSPRPGGSASGVSAMARDGEVGHADCEHRMAIRVAPQWMAVVVLAARVTPRPAIDARGSVRSTCDEWEPGALRAMRGGARATSFNPGHLKEQDS